MIETRSGIRIVPDQTSGDAAKDDRVEVFGDLPPAKALDATLSSIATRYGPRTRYVVAMQLEYPKL